MAGTVATRRWLLCAALGLAANLHHLVVAGDGNILVFGTRRPNDKLLFEYSLKRLFKTLQVLTESVTYPMTPGQKPGLITQIEVVGSGTGAIRSADEIKIKNGGVNERFVEIIFSSARSRGLNYKIRIYGFPAGALTLTTARPARLAPPRETGEEADWPAGEGEGLDVSDMETDKRK